LSSTWAPRPRTFALILPRVPLCAATRAPKSQKHVPGKLQFHIGAPAADFCVYFALGAPMRGHPGAQISKRCFWQAEVPNLLNFRLPDTSICFMLQLTFMYSVLHLAGNAQCTRTCSTSLCDSGKREPKLVTGRYIIFPVGGLPLRYIYKYILYIQYVLHYV